jgi:hypothetical protein
VHRYALIGASALLLAGCGLSSPTVSTTPDPNERQESQASQHRERQAKDVATLGDSLTLAGTEYGLKMRVTLLRVVDPASPANAYLGPGKGNRFVAVGVELANVGARVYRDFPANGAVLIDSRSHQFQSAVWDVKAGPTLGQATIARGDKRVGFITFEVPKRARLVTFQLTLNSGFGPEAGEWGLRG